MSITDNTTVFGFVRNLLLEGQAVDVRVMGQSMLPFFRSGSRIRLRPVRPGDLIRGHVVLGETDTGTFVVHRLIRVEASHIVLLGDGNVAGTETIPRERIYGIVDCGLLHLQLARIWLWMRPVRKYPLWILRKICRK